jgi:hypothetical protein
VEIIRWEWRSGRDTVGIVLVQSSDGLKRAYMGVAKSATEETDVMEIAHYGARLRFEEARAFFPELTNPDEYGHQSL